MNKKWTVLPLVLLVLAGILIPACDKDGDTKKEVIIPDVEGIALKTVNAHNGRGPDGNPASLPPGGKVGITASVAGEPGVNMGFTVTVDDPMGVATVNALPDVHADAKVIRISASAAALTKGDRPAANDYITVTVTSKGTPEHTDTWKFVIYGEPVNPDANFTLNLVSLKFPNPNVDQRDETITTALNRFRLTGTMLPEGGGDPDPELGKGNLEGEDIFILKNAEPDSILRLYIENKKTSEEDGYWGSGNGVNGWDIGYVCSLTAGPIVGKPGQFFYVDLPLDSVVKAIGTSTYTFVNMYHAALLIIEVWEPTRPASYVSQGIILENSTGTAMAASDEDYDKIKACDGGSYLEIELQSVENRSGWDVGFVGQQSGSDRIGLAPAKSLTEADEVEPFVYQFTVRVSIAELLVVMGSADTLYFTTWNRTGGNAPNGVTGMPSFVRVEIFMEE